MEIMNQKCIDVQSIQKSYRVDYREPKSALGTLVSALSGRAFRRHHRVLQDVTFSITKGEVVGIVGRNGSGKSTLLRILAGILKADDGKVEVCGCIVPLIQLEHGAKLRLSVRENILLFCAFLILRGLFVHGIEEETEKNGWTR